MNSKTLKEKVLDYVRNVYKKGEVKYAILNYVPKDFWIESLKKLFPGFYVHSGTDFNYSVCFKITINLSPIKGDILSKEFDGYIQRIGFIDLLVISISVVAPYANVRYVRYTFKHDNESLKISGSYDSFNEEHTKYGDKVKKFLSKKYITCLEDDILFEKVDEDISLELRTDDVRVYNCLFDDIDGWPK